MIGTRLLLTYNVIERSVKMKEIYKEVVVIAALLICLAWKKYHVKYLRENETVSVKREYVAMVYAAVIIIVVIGIIKLLGWFAGIYIAIPLSVAVMYLLRKKEEAIQGFCLLLKGGYYLILSVYSTIQYYSKSEKLAELAVGFTISLAIFESATALSDGIIKIKTKNN